MQTDMFAALFVCVLKHSADNRYHVPWPSASVLLYIIFQKFWWFSSSSLTNQPMRMTHQIVGNHIVLRLVKYQHLKCLVINAWSLDWCVWRFWTFEYVAIFTWNFYQTSMNIGAAQWLRKQQLLLGSLSITKSSLHSQEKPALVSLGFSLEITKQNDVSPWVSQVRMMIVRFPN